MSNICQEKPCLLIFHLSAVCFPHLVVCLPFCLAAMWLWAARRRHLAVCVSGQLRHLLALIPLAVSSQHGHRHRRHCHGNRLPRLLGCHQGEQVPASECELIFKYICHSCYNQDIHFSCLNHRSNSFYTSFFSLMLPTHVF